MVPVRYHMIHVQGSHITHASESCYSLPHTGVRAYVLVLVCVPICVYPCACVGVSTQVLLSMCLYWFVCESGVCVYLLVSMCVYSCLRVSGVEVHLDGKAPLFRKHAAPNTSDTSHCNSVLQRL